jgi:hypothetical protein
MSPGRIAAGRRRVVRAIVALTAALACLGAVAYAATRSQRPAAGLGGSKPVGVGAQQGGSRTRGAEDEALLRARFLELPDAVSTATEIQFRFHVPPRPQRGGAPAPGPVDEQRSRRRFQCKLDGGGWGDCSSPYPLSDLAIGDHAFAVRAFNRADRPGPVASYSWQQASPPPPPAQADPKPFTIELGGALEDLYPGYPPQPLPLLIVNPNPVPIEVTSVTAAIAGDSPGCAAENFSLTPSSVSPATPLALPANASVSLPTATAAAPTISMLNLSVNQDACRGAAIPLVFAGEAHG